MLGIGAFLLSTIATPIVRRLAIARNFVDKPGQRKIHENPIALGGGMVIFWVTLLPILCVACLALLWNQQGAPAGLSEQLSQHIAGLAKRAPAALILVGCALLLHLMGLFDDKFGLGPFVKLFIQIGVAVVLSLFADVRLSFFIPSPLFSVVITVLWMVVIINAFNFLDNMDGLTTGIAIICSCMILTAAINSQQYFVSGLLVLLIGSLAGFLIYNFSPAKIFLGDSGSLVIGLLVAVASIQTTYYQQSNTSGQWYGTLMPLIVMAVPIYDFISVVILRLLAGKNPFVGDTQHFSHRLVKRGMTHRQAVLTIYFVTGCTGLGGIFLHQLNMFGAIAVFAQTIMMLLIIAILEIPGKSSK